MTKQEYKDKNIEKVIKTATNEIGYKETPNNINKYAKEYDSKYKGYWYGLKNGAEWCSIFFSWLFLQFGVDIAKKMLYQPVKDNYGASCSYQYQYYAKNNAITDKPEKGLQIFFKNTKGKIIHTGLIIKVTAQKIYTIEGNKDNQVKKCTYNINSSKIFGFGIPDYTYGYKKDDDASEKPKNNSNQETNIYRVIAKSGLRLREKPNTTCKTIAILGYNTTVSGSIYNKDWIKTKSGYLFSKYLEKIEYSNNIEGDKNAK